MTFPLLLSIFKQTTSQNEKHIELASLTSSAPHEDCLQQFRLLTFDNAHLVAAPWVQWYRGLKRQSSPCFSRKGGCGTTQAGTCPGEVRAVNVGCRWKRGFRVLSKGNFIIEMANELWSFYQSELVNSQELKDQINQLQQQNQAEQELHATELQQLREEKTQLQQQHARELHQLQGGQQQPGAAEAKAWMDKASELQQELEHVKDQKSVVERQKALLESNVNAGKGGAPLP